MVRRAVFLDRDGVINANVVRCGRPVAPRHLSEFRLLPGVTEAVLRLRNSGFVTVVVTNQPDIGAGHTSRNTLDAMHAAMRLEVPMDDIRVCCHVDADGCGCRKPKPGLILEAAAELGVELTMSYLVGDRWRDIEAGRAAGCRTIGVNYRDEKLSRPDVIVDDLPQAAEYILRTPPRKGAESDEY